MIIYPIDGKHADSVVDVSVIIPVYKSKSVLREQILRWTQDPGLNVELLYVHNKCPQNSVFVILDEWNRRFDKNTSNVKILMMDKNTGFGGACNAGAYHAKGKYLIFLNADTTVTPNWITPMIQLFDDPTVGIVGNLQIKEGTLQGTIDSAGSEWFWDSENFVHIGRHCFNGKMIDSPLHYDEMPYDLRQVQEREMVTGCCFAIPKKLYQEVGGFNEKYKLGYWEDSELSLTVREMGYKIMFQPQSVIFHKLAHSGGAHALIHRNKNLFMGKWVDSGRLDKLVKARRPMPIQKITNILVRRMAAHGDVLLASAVVPALKKLYPDSVVYFHTICPTVLLGHPDIDYIVDDTPHNVLFQLFIDLDLAYERRPHSPMMQCYADEAGVPIKDCELSIARGHVNKPGLDNYVVIHAGMTAWAGRNWLDEYWVEIAVRLHNLGYHVVCVGRGGDRHVPCDADCRNMTTVQELATLIGDAKLFVGIDSMPFQIAQATKTPSVCFFGCVDPKLRIINDNVRAVTAKNLDCLGCLHRQPAPSTGITTCPTGTWACEKTLSVDEFWAAVVETLALQTKDNNVS